LILLLESPTNCMGMRDSCTIHVVYDSKLDFWDYIGSLLLLIAFCEIRISCGMCCDSESGWLILCAMTCYAFL